MRLMNEIGLKDVQAVYGGVEGQLWELVMGEQIHIGGFQSSMALAEKAGIGPGLWGVDLCCCNGAGMRFLVQFHGVTQMIGVDATERVIHQGEQRSREEGLAEKIRFVLSDVCQTSLPGHVADFVWGEDAWCYVADKEALIAEAVRLVKSGGVIAFTDWVEGKQLDQNQAERYMRFMKFPSILTLEEYGELLRKNGCEILYAGDTGRFAPCVDLYLDMLNKQLTYDALKIIGFDVTLMGRMGGEMEFMRGLAHEGKIGQGMVVARKQD
jgi:ubiquinone/menaquinone biosynthesis C-methylase UbiE